MRALIGSKQVVRVEVNEEGRKNFYILGDQLARIQASKPIYGTTKKQVKAYVSTLVHDQLIHCEVLDVHLRKQLVFLKVLL